MKHSPERQAFDKLVDHVLSVSHEEITRREAEYKKRSDANPRKRGSKSGVLNHVPRAKKTKPIA